MHYNPNKIEKKWQKVWEKTGIYKAQDKVSGKENFYHLAMFPYPSGNLHIGHWYNFAPADVYARFKKMLGFNVMSPMGFDAFGLPAENAAIKRGIHPKTWTHENIIKMREQLKSMGNIYDWSREVVTCEPDYYKWTQWLFLQFYKNGLAYKAKVPANWCPSCKTVLANEQAEGGKCERCDSQVIQEEIEQWLFKISSYADELLKDIDNLDWPETTKIMQKNWIGRSEGWQIEFKIKNLKLKIPVFTTRADTLFGCTYIVVAPEHPILKNPNFKFQNPKFIDQYINESKKKTERERISEMQEKTGVELKGIKAINPANGREVPIFIADYVLMHYGTGAIMAVPAHDNRDFDFAKKYNLPVKMVICPNWPKTVCPILDKAYESEGYLVDSDKFDGTSSRDARERIGEWLEKQEKAERKVYYRLKDWLISRQRYWGAPIPMVFFFFFDWQPVSERELPVLLPDVNDYLPTGEGKSPLAKSKKFINTVCPKCGGPAQRETDTMDTFICSSWYYLRYADSSNKKEFASKQKLEAWLPVNMYIGGAEHSVMHLLYSRFFTKALNKMGLVDFSEPFASLRHQGIILGPDGQKMSKSRGNVVDPDEQVKKYGADAVRMYLCFMGPHNQGGPYNPNGLVGISRFLNRAWDLFENPKSEARNSKQIQNFEIQKLLNKTIKKVTEDIENFRFNTAVSALMILINELSQKTYKLDHGSMSTFLLLLAPFAPHMAEELWHSAGNKDSIHNQEWPRYDLKLIEEEKINLIVQINGKVRDKIEAPSGISEKEASDLVIGNEKIKKWLQGKEIKKIIFVPGKLINLVI
ncbi:MAG: leucine--tRNA ligase [Candidatus Nealsonbacteria bacterium]|nr:leucine--tRNA ligase [Candidatus Nealsonbacteria bacterium]